MGKKPLVTFLLFQKNCRFIRYTIITEHPCTDNHIHYQKNCGESDNIHHEIFDVIIYLRHRNISACIGHTISVCIKYRFIMRKQPAVGIIAFNILYSLSGKQFLLAAQEGFVKFNNLSDVVQRYALFVIVENNMATVLLYLINI